jgi:hypothetical protein
MCMDSPQRAENERSFGACAIAQAHDRLPPLSAVSPRGYERTIAETLLVGAADAVGGLGHQLGLTNHEGFVTANLDRAGGLGL